MATTNTAFCPVCNQQRLIVRATTNNTFHLIMTVITCGLWLIVWFLQGTSRETSTWRCSVCGTPLASGLLRVPTRSTGLFGTSSVRRAPCHAPGCTCPHYEFEREQQNPNGTSWRLCACAHPAGDHI